MAKRGLPPKRPTLALPSEVPEMSGSSEVRELQDQVTALVGVMW